MKKFYWFLLAFLVFFSTASTYAEEIICPEGYERHTLETTYSKTINGATYNCLVYIVYCCRWNVETQSIESRVMCYDKLDPDCGKIIKDDQYFSQWVAYMVAHDAAVQCRSEYPPCGSGEYKTVVFVTLAQCAKWVNYLPDGESSYKYKLVFCSFAGTCITNAKVCFDYNTGDEQIEIISQYASGTPDCPYISLVLPPSGKTDNEPWETQCVTQPCPPPVP